MQNPLVFDKETASPLSSFFFKPDEEGDSSAFRSKSRNIDNFFKETEAENLQFRDFFKEFRENDDPNPEFLKETEFFPDFVDVLPENRGIIRKKDVVGRTAKINAYLKPRISQFFGAEAKFKAKQQILLLVYEALFVLQWPLENFEEIFNWFYYDAEGNQLNSWEDVYEEFSRNDVFFVEEYEKEAPNLVLAANLAKDFWETEQKPLQKAKKLKRKRRIPGKSAKKVTTNDYIQQQISKLLKEREEFYSTRGLFEEFSQENQEKDGVFVPKGIGNKISESISSKAYGLREKKAGKSGNFEDFRESLEKIDKEEAQIFNRRFKKRYSELLHAKRQLKKDAETPILPQTNELNDQQLRKKIEESLLQKLQNKKSKVSGCFLEDSPRKSQEICQEPANSKQDFVKLSDLGEKNGYFNTKEQKKAGKTGKRGRTRGRIPKKTQEKEPQIGGLRTRGAKVKEIIDLEEPNSQCFQGNTNIKWEFNINFNKI